MNLMRAERTRMQKQCGHLLSLGRYMAENNDPDMEHLYQFLMEQAAEMGSASKGNECPLSLTHEYTLASC